MLKLTKLVSLSKEFQEGNEEVVDVILFGSLAREKKFPGDIDICLILKSKDEGLVKQFKDILEEEFKKDLHLSLLSIESFPEKTLWQSLVREGYSLTKERKWSEMLGYESKALYWYELKKLDQSEKVRFYYALKGRKAGGGILEELEGKHLGKGVITVPLEGDDEMREFFLDWEVPFHRREILVGK